MIPFPENWNLSLRRRMKGKLGESKIGWNGEDGKKQTRVVFKNGDFQAY